MRTVETRNDAVHRRTHWACIEGGEDWYREGHCVTRHGLVRLYLQEGYAFADMVHGGRSHMRVWRGKPSLTPLGLSRLAHKFAREVADA